MDSPQGLCPASLGAIEIGVADIVVRIHRKSEIKIKKQKHRSHGA